VLLLEGADILPHLLRCLPQRIVALGVGGREPGDVAWVEDCRVGPDHFQLLADDVQVLLLQHAGEDRGIVGVVGEGVPSAEDQIFEAGERYEVLDLGHPVLGALAQANRAQLGQGSDGLGEALLDQLGTCDKRGRYCPHPRDQYP
jgi:hypothetical protein